MKMTKRLSLAFAITLFTSGCTSISFLSSQSTSNDSGSSDSLTTSQSTSTTANTSLISTSSISSFTTSYQSYTVTFVTNASATLDPITVSHINSMPIVTNGSLTLEGWYLDAAFTQPINFPYHVTGNITLYARWIEASPGFVFKPTTDGLGYLVEAYVGNATNLAIQSTYNGKPVQELGAYLFYNNGTITSLALPSQLKIIGLAAFKNANQLSSIMMPNSVTEIKTDAFSGATALTNITFSQALRVIDNNAFENLINLTAITLPSSLEEIYARSFGGCVALNEVRLQALTPPLRFPSSFEGTPSSLRYLVPANALSAYQTSAYWSDFTSQISSY